MEILLKLWQLGKENLNLSYYFSVFVATLIKPTLWFPPKVAQVEQPHIYIPPNKPHTRTSLNPKLFVFLIISILFGAILNSIVPARAIAPDILITSVVTLAVWFAYSCITYFVCILLGGKGSFWETVSISLQLLAVIYVVSNFTTLLWGVTVQWPLVYSLIAGKSSLLDVFIDTPIFSYFVVHFTLMFIYLPLALKNVHGFRFTLDIRGTIDVVVRLLVVGVIIFFGAILGLICYISTNIVTGPPTLIPTSTPSPTLIPTSTPSPTKALVISPEQFIQDYYNGINNRRYDKTWLMLSDNYKARRNPTGQGDYEAYWNGFAKVEVQKVVIDSQTAETAVVTVQLRYTYPSGNTVDDQSTFKLVADSTKTSWLIDE